MLDELFDAVVISAEVGLHKPQPEIYLLAAERLGVEPAECVFVDDLRENCAGRRGGGHDGDPPPRRRRDDRASSRSCWASTVRETRRPGDQRDADQRETTPARWRRRQALAEHEAGEKDGDRRVEGARVELRKFALPDAKYVSITVTRTACVG